MIAFINGLRKRKIDIPKSIWYSRKWAHNGHIVATKRTMIQAGRDNLCRDGSVHIGCPKGIFGHIGIPGVDWTLIKVDNRGRLHLGNNVSIYAGVRVIVADYAEIKIGENSSIAANTYLLARKQISIGCNCAISWDCQIMDSDFHSIETESEDQNKDLPVTIGNHVLICSKVTILKGVKIGDHAIIAANSVVTRDIPDGVIAGGNPARIIKRNTTWC